MAYTIDLSRRVALVTGGSLLGRGAGRRRDGRRLQRLQGGLEGLTRGYAARAAKDGVTVNAIAPGPTDTEMGAPLKAAGAVARIPSGRMGEAEDVAEATILFVHNAFITGQTIAVNGGLMFL
jgi:3-oxoacyl-[acyl-carrier protein] reductase